MKLPEDFRAQLAILLVDVPEDFDTTLDNWEDVYDAIPGDKTENLNEKLSNAIVAYFDTVEGYVDEEQYVEGTSRMFSLMEKGPEFLSVEGKELFTLMMLVMDWDERELDKVLKVAENLVPIPEEIQEEIDRIKAKE